MHTAQRTFDHLRTEQAGPRAARPRPIVRRLAHADARDLAERTGYAEREARQAALDHLRRLFHDYLHKLGQRATFQSVWFIRWLDETGQRPQDLDLRCMGGLVGPLLTRGFIRTIGHQPDGGNPSTNHNSATRPLFEIVKLP